MSLRQLGIYKFEIMVNKGTLILALCILINNGFHAKTKGKKEYILLDSKLKKFNKWIGVPHTSVQGLAEGTFQSNNVHKGTPLGLNKDVKNVFSVISENGEDILKITGEIYGGLTTKKKYSNYHLSLFFKWGEKKWPPRENIKRDSGILYHCYGKHGRFWHTWMTSLEYQVQEKDMGDFIPLGNNIVDPREKGPIIEIRASEIELPNGKKRKVFNPNTETYFKDGGFAQASSEPDFPNGEWNHLEIFTVGNDAVHMVNGVIVNVIENAHTRDGKVLDKGVIQIQSEAAECYYKNITLTKISEFPEEIVSKVRFKE